MSTEETERLAQWVLWREKMTESSGEELARALLKEAPHYGRLSDLVEIAAERLAPGIIERMADEQEAKELQAAAEAQRKAAS